MTRKADPFDDEVRDSYKSLLSAKKTSLKSSLSTTPRIYPDSVKCYDSIKEDAHHEQSIYRKDTVSTSLKYKNGSHEDIELGGMMQTGRNLLNNQNKKFNRFANNQEKKHKKMAHSLSEIFKLKKPMNGLERIESNNYVVHNEKFSEKLRRFTGLLLSLRECFNSKKPSKDSNLFAKNSSLVNIRLIKKFKFFKRRFLIFFFIKKG